MKASHLYKLVTERENGEIKKVSYKNDKTPSNHVGGKKMKEVNPLPDTGTKRDNTGKAKVGQYKKKERRSLEGPKTNVGKLKEQGIPPRRRGGLGDPTNPEQISMRGHAPTPGARPGQRPSAGRRPDLPGIGVEELSPEEITMQGHAPAPPRKKLAAAKGGLPPGLGDPTSPEEITMHGHAPTPTPGMRVQDIEPESITMRGHAPTPGGGRLMRAAGRRMESTDNEGSMSKKQPVKQGGPCCKSASVRTKQNDAPTPTAKVGSPKKKEKRSMDANNAPVKDWKGGKNEHKKMGVHEGIKDLERLLQRKINTTFLEDTRKSEPHKVTKGGGKEAEEYWENRRKKVRKTATSKRDGGTRRKSKS